MVNLKVMKKRKALGSLILVILLSLSAHIFIFSKDDSDPKDGKRLEDNFFAFALELPKSLSFAGERIPLEQFDVRERLDRELTVNTYWQSNTLLLHKRANRFFPVIVPILRKHGIPEDFKYLALAESGFQNVKSPAGAAGFWQILEPTGKMLGLEINDDIDERYNLEKSTEAACKYIKDAYSRLGSWSLVAGSYNMGLAGIQNQIRTQKVNNYYDLMLNDETFRYLFRVLALKEVISNPTKYGYRFKKTDLYKPFQYKVLAIDSSISDIAGFANSQKTNYKLFKIANPWLKGNSFANSKGKTYFFKILDGNFDGIEDGQAVKPADTIGVVSPIGQEINKAPETPNKDESAEIKSTIHVVKSGESILSIAKKYGIKASELKEKNNLKKNLVKIGQKLEIEQSLVDE